MRCSCTPEHPRTAIPCSTGWFYPCDPGGIGRGSVQAALPQQKTPLAPFWGLPLPGRAPRAHLSPAEWQGQEGKSCPALFLHGEGEGWNWQPQGTVSDPPLSRLSGNSVGWGEKKPGGMGMGMEGWCSMFCRHRSTVSSPEQELTPQKLRRDPAAFPHPQLRQERFPPRLPPPRSAEPFLNNSGRRVRSAGAADKRGKWLRNGACPPGATSAPGGRAPLLPPGPGGDSGPGTGEEGTERSCQGHWSSGNCISRLGRLGYQPGPVRRALGEEIRFD